MCQEMLYKKECFKSQKKFNYYAQRIWSRSKEQQNFD